MTGLRNLKLTLILVALVLALAIVAEARADVTLALPADTGTMPTTVSAQAPVSTTPAPVPTAPAPVPTDAAPVSTAPAPVSTDPRPVPTSPAPVPTAPAPASQDPAPPAPVPPPPTGADQPTTADGPSTSTSQTIVQVQTSGCLAHCQGTSQTQAAQQQNLTVQTVAPSMPGPPTDQAISDPQPQGSANVTQIQVGCIHDCSGTSPDTTPPSISPGTLSQLLALLGSPTLPSHPPVAPGAQAGVGQSSLQTQQGGGDQSQAASQWSATVQDLVAQAVGGAVQAVNQVTQTIIQVQIGCLLDCTDTHQTQQASQTSTAVQVVAQGVTAATAPVAAAVNTLNQFVWQLQIGCLAWCSDTTQEQSASQSNEMVVTTAPQTSGPAPPPADSGPAPFDPGPAPSDPGPATSDPGPAPAPANPGRAPASPVVAGPKPSPAVAVAVPPVPVVTTLPGSSTGRWAQTTGIGGRKTPSSAPPGPAPAARHAVQTTIAPAPGLVAVPNRTHRRPPVVRLSSSGSWRVPVVHAAPKTTTSSLGPASEGGDIVAIEAVLVAAVAFALGLLLFTTGRLRTR